MCTQDLYGIHNKIKIEFLQKSKVVKVSYSNKAQIDLQANYIGFVIIKPKEAEK